MKRQIITIIMKTTEGIIEAADPIGAIKAVVENLIEALNKGEEANKTVIGDNTKATVGNTTVPMEAITIIITAIIKVGVDMAMVVITAGIVAMVEAVIVAITIINIINITHMMMAHRWSNMVYHVHFAVVLITPQNTVLRQSMI